MTIKLMLNKVDLISSNWVMDQLSRGSEMSINQTYQMSNILTALLA
jgi:hypothetical protein